MRFSSSFSSMGAAVFLSIAMLLAGCGGTVRPVADEPRQAPARPRFDAQRYLDMTGGSGQVFWVQSQASDVRFYLWRGGPLASKGHNHVMQVKNMKGALFLPENMLENNARFSIVFALKDIEVDPLALRAELGGGFATGMTEKGARDTRAHMLSEEIMNASRFPTVKLSSDKVYGEPPKLIFDTELMLHGVRRHQLIPITLNRNGDRLVAEGSFAIKHTAFNIRPSSALGGALYVLDPIMIEFEIVAQAR